MKEMTKNWIILQNKSGNPTVEQTFLCNYENNRIIEIMYRKCVMYECEKRPPLSLKISSKMVNEKTKYQFNFVFNLSDFRFSNPFPLSQLYRNGL